MASANGAESALLVVPNSRRSTCAIQFASARLLIPVSSLRQNPGMETSYFSTFLLVVESGSMSEAARRLEITPAAVAHQLKLLERELETRLLTRPGRTVAPTEAGYRLVEGPARSCATSEISRRPSTTMQPPANCGLGPSIRPLHSLMPELLAGLRQGLSGNEGGDSFRLDGRPLRRRLARRARRGDLPASAFRASQER